MALVNYSSSSESVESFNDEEESKYKKAKLNTAKKCKRKLPIPEFMTKSRKTQEESVIDRPDEHDGRKRTFAHVRGNWASLVYIGDLQETIQDMFKSINFKYSTEIHISLTKTLVLHHHWITSFSQAVLEFSKTQPIFEIRFNSLGIYTNEEKTRTFIGLTVDLTGSTKIKELTNGIDSILEDYRLEKFYSKPLFHASILWCVGNHKEFLENKSYELQQLFDKCFEIEPQKFLVVIEKIHIKIGNKYYNCNLKR
ncbi:U6 snRNA phosphodiesterase 1 isoform X2 [Condylostylus longicornis]|uniref:U6 snRNA phosphodiesterase 1 isoform X2 n=1 Tax=Condylostylus longicornis TaxID=2530218 RepID=UPI00244DBAFE|nr:U6 snRNA phosphodiesterase 1 isoform X2 [Condylostylus longicornis]